jgi:two-component system OmpR family response regulator
MSQETPSPPGDNVPIEASAHVAGQHRILVVDDEPNIADVVSMALCFQGFAVKIASNGRDALAAARSFDPHLLVLDIMLPDMEGFDVAERLGAQRAQLPIISSPPATAPTTRSAA